MKVVTERPYRIHYYEVDYQGKILPTALMNYFQDIAWVQSEQVGVGNDYLQTNKYAWLIYQWDIDIKEYPCFGQTVNVATKACGFNKFNAYRLFQVKDQDENILVNAYSRWVYMDTENMKITIIPPLMYQAYGITSSNSEIKRLSKPRKIEKLDCVRKFLVRYSDIDTNRHVNNVKYVEWSLETMPDDIIKNYIVKNIKTLYKEQGKYGSSIQVETELKNIEGTNSVLGLHKVINNNKRILCLLESIWEQKISH